MSGSIKAASLAVVVLALAGTHFGAYRAGKASGEIVNVKTESTRKDEVLGAVLGAVAANEAEQKQNEAKARKVSDVFQKEVAAVLDYRPPAASVRLPALAFARCGDAAGQAQAPGSGGPDGPGAGTVVFPEDVQRAVDRFTEGVGRLEKEADRTAAVARGHQQFARENGLYGEEGESK